MPKVPQAIPYRPSTKSSTRRGIKPRRKRNRPGWPQRLGFGRPGEVTPDVSQSQNRARLLEVQPRQARQDFCRITVAEVAQEIRLHAAVGEELGVDLGVVE